METQSGEFKTRSRTTQKGVSKNLSPRHYADWAHSPKGFPDRNHAGECRLRKHNEYSLILSNGRGVVLHLVIESPLREVEGSDPKCHICIHSSHGIGLCVSGVTQAVLVSNSVRYSCTEMILSRRDESVWLSVGLGLCVVSVYPCVL